MAKHVMTASRRVALRKAQLASARKRRKGGRLSPRQHRKGIKREKYGSRRNGLTKTQYNNRRIRRNRRIANGVAYGITAAYVGFTVNSLSPGTTKKATNAIKRAPQGLKRQVKYGRSNHEFKKMMKANGY